MTIQKAKKRKKPLRNLITNPRQAYTAGEVADQLSVHVKTVLLWIRKGILPAVRLGGCQRIRHEDLQNLLKNGAPKVWKVKPWPEQCGESRAS